MQFAKECVVLCPIFNDVLFNLLVHYALLLLFAFYSLRSPLEQVPFPFSERRNHHTHTHCLFSGSAAFGSPSHSYSSGREGAPTSPMSHANETNHHVQLLHPLHIHLDVNIRILHASRMILWRWILPPLPKSHSLFPFQRLDAP